MDGRVAVSLLRGVEEMYSGSETRLEWLTDLGARAAAGVHGACGVD